MILSEKMPRTKIVCTIGPASRDEETLRAMVRAGMDVARVNFSHGTHEDHHRTIDLLRAAAEKEKAVLPIIGDLQGPKIRIGRIRDGSVKLRDGATVTLTPREVPGSEDEVHLPHPEVAIDLQAGQRLLLDDGKLELRVEENRSGELRCTVIEGGTLSSGKGVSLPGARLSIATLTEKDRGDTRFAVEHELDFLALSFVRNARDVIELRRLLVELKSTTPIIVKIEKPEALVQFDEILEATDGVMIARGDLGVETPPEHVPFTQKRLIRECRRVGKPVITATQMLDSMMHSSRPTRAEASDVANAILDGTGAVMLSGETAAGQHPVESVRMMARIAEFAEENLPHEEWIYEGHQVRARDSAEAITDATVEMAFELGARAIVTSSYSGVSARLVARHRPRTPIVAITPNPEVHRQMALLWGVIPRLVPFYDTTDEMITVGTRAVVESGIATSGDTIIITAGIPPGAGQKTNMVDVHVIP